MLVGSLGSFGSPGSLKSFGSPGSPVFFERSWKEVPWCLVRTGNNKNQFLSDGVSQYTGSLVLARLAQLAGRPHKLT